MRAPGVIVSVAVHECVLQAVADALALPADSVREANMYRAGTHFTCFTTGTKVQMLTLIWPRRRHACGVWGGHDWGRRLRLAGAPYVGELQGKYFCTSKASAFVLVRLY